MLTALALLLTLQTADSTAGPSLLAPAVETRRLSAEDAHQGVAADAHYLYAISNGAIAKLDKANGRVLARWRGDPRRFIHMNSCALAGANELVCALSNYPAVPMASSAEWFDVRTMRHLRSHSFGHGHGSLTWIDWHDDGWWACFANYDGKGGEPGRDHNWTTLVHYDRTFVERGTWLFPETVLARFAPHSASGGAWGGDGLLYVTGHDRPELYVLRVPATGSRLEHVATISIPTNGQAIAWDPSEARLLWSIERDTSEVVASRVPPVPESRGR